MFSVPYSRIDLRGLLGQLRVAWRASGELLDCPLCGTSKSLSAKESGGNCRCYACGFADDVIGLYAKALHVDYEGAIERMQQQGWIPRDSATQFDRYTRERIPYDQLHRALSQWRERIASGTHPSLHRVLDGLGLDSTPGQDLTRLAECAALVHKDDLRHFVFIGSYVTWMGPAMHLAIPLYAGPARPVGLLLVNRRGEYRVIRLLGDAPRAVSFFTHDLTDHTLAVAMPDVMAAVRLVLTQALFGLHSSVPVIGCINIEYPDRTYEPAVLKGIGRTSLVFWDQDLASSFLWAGQQPYAQVSAAKWEPTINRAALAKLLSQITALRSDRFAAVTRELLSPAEDPGEGRALISRLKLSPSDINAVMAKAPATQRAMIAELFTDSGEGMSVVLEGKVITRDKRGWVHDGQVITDAVIHILSIIYENGVATAHGHVVRSGARWLEAFLFSRGAKIPLIQKRWRTRLVDIALQFHRPETHAGGEESHWSADGSTLVMPNFLLSAEDGVVERETMNFNLNEACAGVQFPPRMLDDDLVELARSNDFWFFFLYLAGKLLEPWHNHRCPSLMLRAGEVSESWMRAMHAGLNLRHMSTAAVDTIGRVEEKSLLPVLIKPASRTTFVKWFPQPGHNAIVKSSWDYFNFARYLGWMVYAPRRSPTSFATVLFPQLFAYINWALTHRPRFDDRMVFYNTIGLSVAEWFEYVGGDLRMGDSKASYRSSAPYLAAHEISAAYEVSKSPGSAFLSVLYDFLQDSKISVEESSDCTHFIVSWPEVVDAFVESNIDKPSYRRTVKMLRDAKHLYGSADSKAKTLRITANSWYMTMMYAA